MRNINRKMYTVLRLLYCIIQFVGMVLDAGGGDGGRDKCEGGGEGTVVLTVE